MRQRRRSITASLALTTALASTCTAQDEHPLAADAEAIAPLVETATLRTMLDAVEALPSPGPRTIYRSEDRTRAYAPFELDELTQEQRDSLTPQEFPAGFYYTTAYGSPLVYARPLDLVAQTWDEENADTPNAFAGKRILDFGYGTIGHLRLLASHGAHCVGTEVQPLFRALYAWPGDQGDIQGQSGAPDGSLTLLHGRWPAELAEQVAGDYDLVISKNVLKRGYIHPARETDPRFTIDLGVADETFLAAVHDALNPGGLFMIYNISPAQNPPDERYLPHADGQCPFTRQQLEAAGFDIIAFDKTENDAIYDYWTALGYDQGKSRDQLAQELFTWYTLARKRADD